MKQQVNFIEKVAILLNLSKTDVEILITLNKNGKLLVSEITKNIKRSERHIRQRLQVLHEKGFLKKDIEVLKNKRIAYRYCLRPLQSMTADVRRDLQKKLDEIEKIAVELNYQVMDNYWYCRYIMSSLIFCVFLQC